MPFSFSTSLELRMPLEDRRQVWYQLLMCGFFLALFIPLLWGLVSAIAQLQPTGNRVFGLGASAMVTVLVLVSGAYLVLFAIHVKAARIDDRVLHITRFLLPPIRIISGQLVAAKAVAASSFKAPGYQRGTLFIAGVSSFYLPNSFPNAHELSSWLAQEDGAKLA